MKFIRIAGFAALVAAAAGLPSAFGQPTGYPVAPPPPVPQPPPQTCLTSGVCSPPSLGSVPGAGAYPGPGAYPPYAYNPYGYPGYQGAVGGALSGAANVISAQGQFQIANQQSRMLQTQADSARIGYRQQLIQEQRYEQSLMPTTLEMRQKEQWQKLQTARNNPTNPDVWSGDALNAMLTALQGAEVQGLKADPVPITTDVLKHINFTTGQQSGAGAGMLKDFTDLQWPFALQSPPFMEGMTTVDGLAKKAIDEVKTNGRVTAATFNALNTAVGALNDQANANQSLSPTDWIEATTFTGDLQSSVQSLRNPDVAQYFKGKFSPQAGTVDELVREMTAQGLRFAPAAQGDQPAYTTMQTLLRTYDYRLATLAAR